MPKTIVMEFNELCPPLIAKWIDEGRLPNFARLQAQSAEFTTDPDVTDPGKLEPWIQWYSAHTGLAYDQHRVFHLTDGPKAGHPDIYATMIAAGRRVGCFAGMNVKPFASPGSFFVGDPWTENGDAYPDELNIYNRFVSQNVREYSNTANRMSLGDYRRFLSFMASHGLKPATVLMILRQLASERFQDHRLSYRRVAILDRLQFDVFSSYYRRMRPEFATFFINSTAHLQHSYWRHMEPEAFTVRPGQEELGIYGDAVRFGYESMDKLVGEFLDLAARHDARLIFMTALSQQPFLRHEETGGQHFYRLSDVRRFLSGLGIEIEDVDPTMTHQYLARFRDRDARDRARERLQALTLDDRQVIGFATIETSDLELYFGCQISAKTSLDAVVHDRATGSTMRFGSAFYQIEAIKSGRHHPAGMLWIQNGEHQRHSAPVSILDIFPTLLDLHGVTGALSEEHRGRSLVPLLSPDQQRLAA